MEQTIKDELWNTYFYEGTEVLINNKGIKNLKELQIEEANESFKKLLKLSENSFDFKLDKEYLKKLHLFIFSDIYPFAGKYRRVNLMKARGNFLQASNTKDIEEYLDGLFKTTQDNLGFCQGVYQFSEIVANLYTKLIYCHPFREGNGRCIREFIREFVIVNSKKIGGEQFELDWRLINRDELDKNIEIAHRFPGLIMPYFMNALVPIGDNKKIY